MKNKRTDSSDTFRAGLTRRGLLKTTGAAAAGTGLGLFGGKAPAYAQSRELHYLEWSSFVPASDKEVERQAEEFGKAEGIKMKVEHINNNDLPTRAAAATESGTGPDVIQIWNQYPKLYVDKLVDLSDLFEWAGGKNIYKYFRDATLVNGRQYGVPYFSVGACYAYRTDYFKQAGAKVPTNWDEFLKAGTACKKIGFPVGQALGHSFGDPTGFCYNLLWGFGGKAADEHGKVAVDSKETRTALQFMKEFWTAACDEGGLAWDDSSNNRAFAAGTISASRNGASIYFSAKKDLREKKSELANVTDHFLDPRGIGPVRVTSSQYNRIIFKYSKVQTAAKNWIKFGLEKANYSKLMEVNGGYTNGITPERNNHPVWDSDPKLKPFRNLPEVTVPQGWPAPFDRRAAEAEAKYIVVDMFARAVKGESVESAVKFAESELKLIYM